MIAGVVTFVLFLGAFYYWVLQRRRRAQYAAVDDGNDDGGGSDDDDRRSNSVWKKAATPEGKPYWYHTKTDEVRWSKPSE